MSAVSSKLFDVRPGEHVRVARAGGALFAILAGFTLSETARDSLFLTSNGANQLALAYLSLAGMALITLFANAWIVRRVGRRNALVVTLGVAAIGTASFFVLPRSPSSGLALYLWTGLIGTVVVVQFWLLTATRFTTAEAKRLYGPIAASGAVGTLAGAMAAWRLLYVLEIESLLVVGAGFYLAAAILLARDHERVETRLRAVESRRRSSFKRTRARRQPYVIRLAALTVCATAAALLADWLFKSAAAATFQTDALARFIARYNGAVAALSLVFQLVGAAWLVRRVGVLGMALLLPVLLLIGGVAAFMTAGSFVAIGLTKGADGSLRYSVNRVSTELLWMPVADHTRASVREPLESVGTRLVQAIVAALLLVLVTLRFATPTVVAGILSIIVLLWTLTAAGLRSHYLAQLRQSVNRRSLDPVSELDGNAIETVVETLSSPDERRVIAAIHILVARRRAKLIPALILRHDSLDVLSAALAAMTTPGRTDWVPLTRRLLESPQPRARVLALRALARTNDQMAIVAGLTDDDPGVAAHGVFWSLQNGDPASVNRNPAITQLLAETGARSESARNELLDAIRSDGDARWVETMLDLAITGTDATIERMALAIEHVPDARFVPFLIDRLRARTGRAEVGRALRAIGDPALEVMATALADPARELSVRVHLPATLATFRTAAAAAVLGEQLAREDSGAVRYRLLRALAWMAVNDEIIIDARPLLAELQLHLREYCRLLALAVPIYADLDLRESAVLLRGLLADKTSQALDRAFLALQSLHPREDIRGIERAIRGADQRARAHGTEFLDTLTRTPLYTRGDATGIRDRLLVLGEELDDRDRLARLGLATNIPASVADAIVKLLAEPDPLLSACAGFYALDLKTPELSTAIEEMAAQRPLFEPLGVYYRSPRAR